MDNNKIKSVDDLLLHEMTHEDIVEADIDSGYGQFIDALMESASEKRSIFDN